MSEQKTSERWQKLPERVLVEDMVTAQAVDPGQDSTPDLDGRYWLASIDRID